MMEVIFAIFLVLMIMGLGASARERSKQAMHNGPQFLPKGKSGKRSRGRIIAVNMQPKPHVQRERLIVDEPMGDPFAGAGNPRRMDVDFNDFLN